MTPVDAIVAQAEALPPEEFELLVLRLTDRLHHFASPEVEAAWHAEIDRRVAADDRGETTYVPWEQVRKELGLK